MGLKRFLSYCLIICIIPLIMLVRSGIANEENVVSLGKVTVTAERFPVNEKDSARFVTVISSEELRESGGNNLIDAMRRSGGFAYKAYAPLGISHGGMNSVLSIRGVKDGELVLMNGVPIQGAAGHAYDINSIPLDQIECVEILKGAASTLYGADAMSGVINIITKKTKNKRECKVSTLFGDSFYNNQSISAMFPRANFGFDFQHIDVQKRISQSFSKNYRYEMKPTDSYTWNFNGFLFDNLYIDYLGSFSETGFKKIYEDPIKPIEGTRQNQLKNFFDVRYETAGFKTKIFGNHDQMQREEPTSPDTPKSDNINANYGMEGDYKVIISGWEICAGGDWSYRSADYSTQYGRHHRNDFSFFTQFKKNFLNCLDVILGAREQFIDGESGTDDYTQFLPSIGFSYRLNENMNLFTSGGKAFRAPTFNNLYYDSDFLMGNPDLKPETGVTYEAGLKYDLNTFRLRIACFYMAYEDKIEIDKALEPQTYYNAGKYESLGVEWETEVSPFAGQSGWVRYVSIYAAGYFANPTAEDTEGEEYQSGPKFQNSFGIEYDGDIIVIDINCQILTSREKSLEDTAAPNIFSKVKLGKGYLTLAVDNILDEEIEVSGDMSPGAKNQYVYYDLGRMIKAGYELTF